MRAGSADGDTELHADGGQWCHCGPGLQRRRAQAPGGQVARSVYRVAPFPRVCIPTVCHALARWYLQAPLRPRGSAGRESGRRELRRLTLEARRMLDNFQDFLQRPRPSASESPAARGSAAPTASSSAAHGAAAVAVPPAPAAAPAPAPAAPAVATPAPPPATPVPAVSPPTFGAVSPPTFGTESVTPSSAPSASPASR